ncbi:hypothetical protein [Streptomyces sp. NPDC096339]|uniref:hypothetical protein n=1 Tax=Streptomyces sp. NPDC096339 TaxID=3366086 RepID=UPI0038228DAC
MTLLEMGGADDQLRLAGWPEGVATRGALFVFWFWFWFEDLDVPDVLFGVPADGFGVVPAEGFVWGVADRVAVRGETDGDGAVDESDAAGEGDGAGGAEGCTGIPIAGASACPPMRLLPMATARIAPTTETGHPRPRSRRPRRPDSETNTGAGAGSSKSDSGISDNAGYADPRSVGVMTERTLRGLSVQGT